MREKSLTVVMYTTRSCKNSSSRAGSPLRGRPDSYKHCVGLASSLYTKAWRHTLDLLCPQFSHLGAHSDFYFLRSGVCLIWLSCNSSRKITITQESEKYCPATSMASGLTEEGHWSVNLSGQNPVDFLIVIGLNFFFLFIPFSLSPSQT